jgi:hypothetical protein
MSGSDLQAQITAAKAYEEFFVPALFGEWARRVAAAARIRTGDHVLDVACGTADAVRVPFVLGHTNQLTQLVASAGIDKVAVATQHGMARFPSIRFMVEADLRGWLPLMGVVLTEDQINRILQEAEHVLRGHVTATGTVACEIAAHLVTGTRS